MFFEKELILFNILDVIELDQKDVNMFNCGRNFNAISFRLESDAVLKTQTDEYHMGDHFVSYVPARLDYSRSASIDKLIAIHFETTDYTTKSIEYFIPKDHEILTRLFLRILDCWNKKECGYKYRCSAILYEIFAECYSQNFTNAVTKSKISSSVDYILKNYTDPYLTIENIAKRSFMSEVYFRKLFREEYGTSPQKYIISLRIQKAAGLISTGYYSLKEIAYMSGYSDYKYFSTEFKKALGVSPSEYLYSYQK
ncbi:MAG: helix-turn-helix transcriptional regulator [Clostridia bacterium]|nr:helix-turn-helix transcriptional regulator [Clostridia bacterium]